MVLVAFARERDARRRGWPMGRGTNASIAGGRSRSATMI